MKNPITLLVMFKDGSKVAEMDITTIGNQELAQAILLQEMQGRSWEYQFTNLKEMKERRESYE